MFGFMAHCKPPHRGFTMILNNKAGEGRQSMDFRAALERELDFLDIALASGLACYRGAEPPNLKTFISCYTAATGLPDSGTDLKSWEA